MFSVEEVADCLGLSPRTVYNRIGKKAKVPFPIKPKRIGKLVKFRVDEIHEYVKNL